MLQPVKRRSITPDWLPAGWTLEIKTQTEGANIGRQITCYYDPRSRSRFYSEKEVFQHLEGLTVDEPTDGNQFYSTNQEKDTKIDLNTNPCSPKGEDIINGLAAASTSQLENSDTSLNTNVQVDHAPDGLPSGWITETRFRKSKSIIKKDTFYIDAVAGYKFRSLKSALSYIKDGETSKCTFKRIKIEGKVTSKSEPHPQTSITSLTEPGNTVQRCLFSEERADMKVCGEMSKSLVKGKSSAKDKITGPANVELLRPEDVDLSAEKILDGHGKLPPQDKKGKRGQKLDSKQSKTTKAITKPVRASKRLEALTTDSLTESGVASTISTPNNHQLNPNYGLAAEKNDLAEEMKSEVTTNGQLQPAKPCRGHQPRSKRNKFVKATTMPVRASKRLAALRSDIPEKCEVHHSGYDMSMPSNQLEANSDKYLDSNVIDNKNVSKVSDQNPEQRPKIVSEVLESEHIQPENDDLSVSKVKLIKETMSVDKVNLVEQTTLGLNYDEKPESKKLKRGRPRGSKKNASIEKVAMPTQLSNLVAEGLAKSKVEVFDDDKSTCHMEHINNDIQSKYLVANLRFKETSEPSILKVADRFREQSKPTASTVGFEESSKALVDTEKCEESSKFLLPTENFSEEKIILVANLDHQEEPERNEPRGKEISQDHAGVGRQDNHQSEYEFKSLFGNSWPDPCLAFAFKTLTSDIPGDYFQPQPDLTSGPNNCPAPYSNNKPRTMEQNESLSHIGLWDDIWSFGRNDMQSTRKNG